jgi:hypothetical protein
MRSIGWLNKAVVAVVLLMSAATLSAGDHGKKYKRGHFPRGKAHGYYGKHTRRSITHRNPIPAGAATATTPTLR